MSDLSDQLKAMLGYGKDVAQGASNAIAGNVSGPVDLISWGLRKAGLGNVIGDAPVGGSAWMAQKGLTPQPTNALAGGIGETLGMVGPTLAAAKAPQIANGLLQMGENAAKPSTLNPQMGAIVYHGSPHTFDQFDMGKIGTGEGAQAYGHGLYLADSPDVAKSYQKANATWDTTINGAPLTTEHPQFGAAMSIAANGYAKALKQAQAAVGSPFIDQAYAQRQLADVQALKGAQIGQAQAGALYKVDLPDEHIAKMLDWDKPLSQQNLPLPKTLLDTLATHPENARMMPLDPIGGELMNAMTKYHGSADKAQAALKQFGVPGVKYLDQGSRGAGDGTRNYVVFDDTIPKILERNGQSLGDQLRDKLK